MTQPRTPPGMASLDHLRPTDLAGARYVLATLALTAGGIWLALRGGWLSWIAGEVLLGIVLVEWFVVLHECGHGTLFRHRRLDTVVGHLAGFFSLIPFETWKRVHQRHHKWTGWQDVDPTTATLVPRPLAPAERLLVNFCWRYWIPLFSTLYRLNNFWNVPRVFSLFPSSEVRRRLALNSAAMVLVYIAVVAIVGPAVVIRLAPLALLVAFCIEDVLLISQHSHIPMHLSGGAEVEPFPTVAQEPFTRSLRLPRWLSRCALHIDAHELHHMYPAVPGYHLSAVPYAPMNEVEWWRWVPAARAVPGEVLLFQNRNDSGLEV